MQRAQPKATAFSGRGASPHPPICTLIRARALSLIQAALHHRRIGRRSDCKFGEVSHAVLGGGMQWNGSQPPQRKSPQTLCYDRRSLLDILAGFVGHAAYISERRRAAASAPRGRSSTPAASRGIFELAPGLKISYKLTMSEQIVGTLKQLERLRRVPIASARAQS